jgi:hypothetical protein
MGSPFKYYLVILTCVWAYKPITMSKSRGNYHRVVEYTVEYLLQEP